jgi:hypothetical protein
MRLFDLEAWILSVVEITIAGQLPEDSRVELKSKWPDPKKAARRLGGHANSCQADHVLWIIGLQEGVGVVRLEPEDIARWFSEVARQFDGVAPDLQDLMVPTSSGPVLGLLFSTVRRPFVVVNPSFGSVSGVVVEREVPWREGTRIRSAQRSDLINVLASSVASPHLEVLRVRAKLVKSPGRERSPGTHLQEIQYEPHFAWTLTIQLYVTPRQQELLVFPVHRTSLLLRVRDSQKVMKRLQYSVQFLYYGSGSTKADSHTISRTSTEALINGPGVLEVTGELYEPPYDFQAVGEVNARFSVRPAGSEVRASAEAQATRRISEEQDKENNVDWSLEQDFNGA